MEPESKKTRYIARFQAQAWVRDYAMEVDPQGDDTWDATEYLASMEPKARALAMEGGTYESDDLKLDPAAPEWIRHWSGPFEISVELVEGD